MARPSVVEGVVLGAPAVILGILTVVFPSFALYLLLGLIVLWIAAAAILMDRRLRARAGAGDKAKVGAGSSGAFARVDRAMEEAPMDAGAAMVSIPQPREPPTGATPPATRTRPSRASAAEAPACKRGPHEVKAGSPALLELIAQSGDTIVGTVHEKDGYDFSVFIVDRPNRAKYLNDSGRCSKLFKRTSTKAADVEFRIPESASLPCYLVLESRGTTYAREVIVELKTRATGARRAQGKVGL